ncbi:MAG: hypothetical protein ACXVFN_02965 [Solirubrobacteraceae bacterium]
MTERRPTRPRRRPSLGSVLQMSATAFALVLALLVLQLRTGRDPVLGGRAAAPAAAPRRVLVRRVVVTRVLVRQYDDAGEGGAPVTRTVVVPQGTTSAPAVAAPAPAPAPAPLVTKTS